MFFLISIWGAGRKEYSAFKYVLYTLFGSTMMPAGILSVYFTTGSLSMVDITTRGIASFAPVVPVALMFFLLLGGFAVKLPVFPFHTWLPDAHTDAPTAVSVVLAGTLLKMGGYGFVRFSLPITPGASAELVWFVILLSLIAVVYIGFVALVQQDMKKLIAYSSISHMGFVTLGFFLAFSIYDNTNSMSGAAMGIEGGMIQMISHGFVSGALFLCVGVMYDRMHSRQIADYGGVANTMPWFATFMVLFAMANAGLPGTSAFVGEFMVILASVKSNFWIAFLAATTLIIGAAYTLWMVKRVIFGEVKNENVAKLQDLNQREFLVLGSLAFLVLLIGIWPNPLVEVMHASVENLVQHIADPKL